MISPCCIGIQLHEGNRLCISLFLIQVEEDEARRQKDRDEIMAGAERMEDLPSDEEADDMVEKLLAEQKLEEKLGELPSPDDDNDDGTANSDRMG